MAVTAKILASGADDFTTSNETLYTCPVGSTVIVTSVYITNGSTIDECTLYIKRPGETAVRVYWEPETDNYVEIFPKWVLHGGDKIQIYDGGSTNSPPITYLHYHISGVEISPAAEGALTTTTAAP